MLDTATPEQRRFRVHAPGHPTRIVQEPTFEAAAIAYVEDLITSPPVPELRLFVTDPEDGHQHCFVLDLETGDVETCA